MYFIQRFCKKVIVDQKIVLIIARLGQLVTAEGHIADGKVKGVIRQFDALKAVHSDICLRVKLLCDSARDTVQLDTVQLGAVILFRQQTKEIADAHRRFQHGVRLDTHVLQRGIHGADHRRRGVVGVQRGAAGGGVFLRCQQSFQLKILFFPFFVLFVKRLRDAAPAGVAGKDRLFIWCRLALLCFQLFQQSDRRHIVLILAFLTADIDVAVRQMKIFRLFRLLREVCRMNRCRIQYIEVQNFKLVVDQLLQTVPFLL